MTSRFAAFITLLSLVAACESSSSSTTAGAADVSTDAASSDTSSETPTDVEEAPDDTGASEPDTFTGIEEDTSSAVEDTTVEPSDDTGASVDVEPVEDVTPEEDTSPSVDVAPEEDTGPACVPECTGKVCGPDGCGGECGTCGEGKQCTLGLCSSPGACTNDADGNVLASIDVAAVVEGCAKGCILAGDKATCGGDCLAKEAGLSADCAACFGGNVACAFTKCTFECGFGTAEACLSCQKEAGCFVEFESCAGLPPP
jgi:hypothetical protein